MARLSNERRLSNRKNRTRKSMNYGVQLDKKGGSASLDILQMVNDPDSNKSTLQLLAFRVLHAPAFENCMGVVVVFNILVMVIETDRSAKEEEAVDSTVHWTEVCGWVVLFIFAVELFLRLFALRTNFWMDAWNVFDFMVVCTDVTVSLIALAFEKVFPVAMLRIFRLAKLARVSKVLRVFPELRLLLASLLSSLSAIVWGAVLLVLVLLVWSMVAVLFIHPLNKQMDHGACERCARAYSSVLHSSLTFWEKIVTSDNWGEGTIALMEKHPSTGFFFIPLFLTVGMAVVSLILGMVVSVAQRAEAEIREVENAQDIATKYENKSNLLKLCKQMDADNSGEISQEELLAGFEQPCEFRDSMEMLGITKDDFDVLWAILDVNNAGSVSYTRLVAQLYSLKTSDTEFTLAYLKYHVTMIRDILMEMEEEHHKDETIIEDHLQKIENQRQSVLEQRELWRKSCLKEAGEEAEDAAKVEDPHIAAVDCDAPKKENQGLACVGDTLTKLGNNHAAESGEEHKMEDLHGAEKRENLLLERLEKLLEKVQGAAFDAPEEAHACQAGKALAASAEVPQAAKSKELHARNGLNAALNEVHQSWSAIINGSADVLDETRSLLRQVSIDIDKLRLDLNLMFTTVDRKLSSHTGSEAPVCSAMEREVMKDEARLELLAVPEKVSSCRVYPGRIDAKPPTQIG